MSCVLSRREFLSRFGTACAVAGAGSPAWAQDSGEGLGDIAAGRDLLFGGAIGWDIEKDQDYRALTAHESRIVTADNALKFDWLRPKPEGIDFSYADAMLAFAERHKLAFRGHTLVWNENTPAWLKLQTTREIAAILDGHIERVVGRYAGRVHSWDVVNEAIWPDHGEPYGYRKGIWYNILGPKYVARAFRRAAEADPQARLVLNEAFTERQDRLGLTVRRELLRLIDDLQHQGVPLHAIGLQGHLQPQFPSDDDAFVAFLQQLAARKLDIYITEFDVDDSSFGDDPAQRDAAVAARTKTFLSKALSVPAVKAVVAWQLADKYSWYRGEEMMRRAPTGRLPHPLPFDDQLRRKPMWEAMAEAFRERRV